ncbi:MAG: ribosome biogenesis GTPase YlqF [Lentisphaeria bacterium]|nr:ribosome biogenesis GTPase YlqF [Lentisphaeria bacterium]
MTTNDLNSYPLTGWFPGHMLKAGRQMQEALKLIDLLVELVDARAPLSTRNPELLQKLGSKPALLVASKADLASPLLSRRWESWFATQGERVFFLDAHKIANVRGLVQLWKNIVLEERTARGATRPLLRPVRIMILGIPNIGKSTLVNRLHEKKKALVGPKPGVTRQNQWIPIADGVELLDTPGVLWPRIENKCHELLLTLLGNIKDEIVGSQLIAQYLCLKFQELGMQNALSSLIPPEICNSDPEEILTAFAQHRNFLLPGGVPDRERAANALIREFRDGRLGRFSLEAPPE